MLLGAGHHLAVPSDERRRGEWIKRLVDRLHGEEFKGEKIPFGALVDFKPSEARGEKREQIEPRGETGIFAGYVLSTGMHWANKCRAWALAAFAGAELNIKKAKVPPRLRMPHQTERMI